MAKYRKKPVVIEAFQLPHVDDDKIEVFLDWAREVGFTSYFSDYDGGIAIEMPHDAMARVVRADPGDFIIKGVKGEFYPCKPDVFGATYEKVEE